MPANDVRELIMSVSGDEMDDEYLAFDRIANKRSSKCDLHAFLLLDELCPTKRRIIRAAEHDEIYINVSLDDVQSITREQVIELLRCGVRFDPSYDCFRMNV